MKFSVISFRLSHVVALALCALLLVVAQTHAQTDPLPSWNDGSAKQAIIQFVQAYYRQVGSQVRCSRRPDRHL